jgi:hypothetical protein
MFEMEGGAETRTARAALVLDERGPQWLRQAIAAPSGGKKSS